MKASRFSYFLNSFVISSSPLATDSNGSSWDVQERRLKRLTRDKVHLSFTKNNFIIHDDIPWIFPPFTSSPPLRFQCRVTKYCSFVLLNSLYLLTLASITLLSHAYLFFPSYSCFSSSSCFCSSCSNLISSFSLAPTSVPPAPAPSLPPTSPLLSFSYSSVPASPPSPPPLPISKNHFRLTELTFIQL